jgi:hypothetical protein
MQMAESVIMDSPVLSAEAAVFVPGAPAEAAAFVPGAPAEVAAPAAPHAVEVGGGAAGAFVPAEEEVLIMDKDGFTSVMGGDAGKKCTHAHRHPHTHGRRIGTCIHILITYIRTLQC